MEQNVSRILHQLSIYIYTIFHASESQLVFCEVGWFHGLTVGSVKDMIAGCLVVAKETVCDWSRTIPGSMPWSVNAALEKRCDLSPVITSLVKYLTHFFKSCETYKTC